MLWGLACFVFSFVLKIGVVGVVGPFLFNCFSELTIVQQFLFHCFEKCCCWVSF